MPHAIDLHVGLRIRRRRWVLQFTQHEVASRIGITFQQLQKYETGLNRISASRLWEISTVLRVPVGHFFEGFEGGAEEIRPEDEALEREATEMLRAYFALPQAQRRPIAALARALGAGGGQGA
ncbi:MAG: hypothetical protein RL123_566 [Pseudomonadota bacterium]